MATKGSFKRNTENIKTGEVFIFDLTWEKNGHLKSAPLIVDELTSRGVLHHYEGDTKKFFNSYEHINRSIQSDLISRQLAN